MPTVTLCATITGAVTLICDGETITLTPDHAEALVTPIRDALADLYAHRVEQRILAHYLIACDENTLALTDLDANRIIFLTVPGALGLLTELPRFAALARILWGAKPVLSAALSPAEGPAPQPETLKPRPDRVRTFTLH